MRLHAQQVIPAEWALTILTLFLVCLRLYLRAVKEALFDTSDCLVLFAWVLSIGSVICDTAAIRLHMWRSRIDFTPHYISMIPRIQRRETAMKLLFASAFPYYVELWSVKAAMVLLYYQLVPKEMKKTRIAMHVTSAFVGVSFLLVMGLTLFWCMPIHLNWSLDIEHDCVAVSGSGYEPFYIITGLHLLTDAMILLLPISYIKTLSLRRTQKVGVSLLFLFGILYMACTIARTIAIAVHANIPTVGLITCIERAMSIMVVCFPSFKSLYKQPHGSSGTGDEEELQAPHYAANSETSSRNAPGSSSGWRTWLAAEGGSTSSGKTKTKTKTRNGNGGRIMQQSLSVVSRQTSSASQDRNRRAVDGWVKSATRPPSDASDISGVRGGRISGRSEDGADPIAQYKRAYGDRIIADRSNPDQRASFEYR